MRLALLRRTRREAESLQSVVGGVDYAAIFERDFWAEYSPVGRLSSTWLCHFDLRRWASKTPIWLKVGNEPLGRALARPAERVSFKSRWT
jgi:hypothetical protein